MPCQLSSLHGLDRSRALMKLQQRLLLCQTAHDHLLSGSRAGPEPRRRSLEARANLSGTDALKRAAQQAVHRTKGMTVQGGNMTDLPKRELGRTGLQVTMLGYGAMELRGAPRGREVTEAQAETILHAALDAGINYIDTSIDYGLSEERIGRYIAARRSEYYLASKCGCVVGATPAPRGQRNPHVFTRDNIIAGVEQSLVRMKTHYIDVLQFHASPSKQTLEEHDALEDRKSTRLNSSHLVISYAVFCLKKKKEITCGH